MDFGIILGDTPTAVSERDHFDSILRQVEAAQRAGMNHVLMGQHFMFEGSRWFQPVPVMARLAGELDPHVRLVTQIVIAPLYHPVMLAEELATLDVVTGGRISVGLGIGYLPREYEVFGVPFGQRGSRLEETVLILKQMWTQDRVDHTGRHFTLVDVPVHIRPLQQPHPPIWIGAGSAAGIDRAARLDARWPITPQVPPGDLARQLTGFFDARERAGLSRSGRQPLRREIMLGTDHDSALARAVEVATPWYVNMARTGHNKYVDPEGLVKSIPGVLSTHWVLGSPQECAAQLRDIGATVPVDPVVTRANWPGMSPAESVAYIDQLGEQLIPLLADFEPVDEVAVTDPVGSPVA
jgi:alkanesulfonate monooxygenase SsuD/methylene tetrahydromethanopterin reductase-like flavin-dependent oxidoreductase (luciferase family)